MTTRRVIAIDIYMQSDMSKAIIKFLIMHADLLDFDVRIVNLVNLVNLVYSIMKTFKQYTHNITITLYKINPSKIKYIPKNIEIYP